MPQVSTAPPARPTQPVNIPPVAVPGPAYGQFSVPNTQADVDALQAQRSELSSQLISAKDRRNELARQLRSARSGPDQSGIEARITQLDTRIMTIESDIAESGRALAAAPSGLKQTNTSTGVPYGRFGPLSSSQVTGISIVGIIFVVAPMVIGSVIMMMRRGLRPPPPPVPKELAERLERMEHGIEAVALEVERIGEGQRFVTQLMSDRAQRAALPETVRPR